MDYVFVLGKNEELSMAEILYYFKARNVELELRHVVHEVVVFRLNERIDPEKVMLDLGGTIKICELIDKFNIDEILHKQTELNLYRLFPQIKNNKIRFGISVYARKKCAKTIWDIITTEIKKLLRESNIKMIHITPSNGSKFPVLKHFEVLRKLMKRGGCELVVHVNDKIMYISKTMAVHNPYEFKKRDVERPSQRTIYSIPPRLGKILINLSSAKPGDLLLDPFCGVGTILQEGLLMGMDIRGVDTDPYCIKKSMTNLEWIKKEYNMHADLRGKLIVGDTRRLSNHIRQNSIDAVATEPYLGPPLDRKPTRTEAKKILEEVRPLYLKSLKEINKVLKPGKSMSIIFPNFETREGIEVGLDTKKLAEETGFVIIYPFKEPFLKQFHRLKSIIDADVGQKTRREVCILEKRL